MPDYTNLETQFVTQLGLSSSPVAVLYRAAAPAGIEKFSGIMPSGCSYWRLAADGHAFYTVPADHYNCPIGSYTHNLPLPPEREHELGQTLEMMAGIGYVRMEEIPSIPRLKESPGVVVYAPLRQSPAEPDVALFVLRPAALMLLSEAALAAGVSAKLPLMARPTCMALPTAIENGMVASGGCIGNRVYTELGDAELYAAVPGNALERLAGALDRIVAANATLRDYHLERRRTLTSA